MKLPLWAAEVINAFIVALIAFIGQLIYYGWPPTYDRLYLSALIGILTFLTLCLKTVKRIIKKLGGQVEEKEELQLHTAKTVILPDVKNNDRSPPKQNDGKVLSLWVG